MVRSQVFSGRWELLLIAAAFCALVVSGSGCGSSVIDAGAAQVSGLSSSSKEQRLDAARFFHAQKNVPSAALQPLLNLLDDADAEVRAAAALAIGEFQPAPDAPADAVADLVETLKTAKQSELDSGVQTALEQAIYKLEHPSEEPLIHSELEDENGNLPQDAAMGVSIPDPPRK